MTITDHSSTVQIIGTVTSKERNELQSVLEHYQIIGPESNTSFLRLELTVEDLLKESKDNSTVMRLRDKIDAFVSWSFPLQLAKRLTFTVILHEVDS